MFSSIETNFDDFQNRFDRIEFVGEETKSIRLFDRSIELNRLGEDLNLFSLNCRRKFVDSLKIDVDPSDLSLKEIESIDENSWRNVFRRIEELRYRIVLIKEMFSRSILSEENPNENFIRDDFFSSSFESKEKIFISSKRKNLDEKLFRIRIVENDEEKIYLFEEKSSLIYQIDFRRLITSIDEIQIGIPLSKFTSTKNSSKRFFVRLEKFAQRSIFLPTKIEMFDDVFYSIFSLDECFFSLKVEVLRCFHWEQLQHHDEDEKRIFLSEFSTNFRLETTTKSIDSSPLFRQIPMTNFLSNCFQNEHFRFSSSDLFEFQWSNNNEFPSSIDFSLTISLTKSSFERSKTNSFRREKPLKIHFDENFETTSTNFEHFPTLKNLFETNEKKIDETNLSTKKRFKWKFDEENSSMFLFTSNNRKWKNSTNFVEIKSTNQKDLFQLNFQTKNFFDRLILIRSSVDWRNNEGKFDQIGEILSILPTKKCFSCFVAKNSSRSSHFGLIVVENEKEKFAENFLREKHFDEFLFDEQRTKNDENSSKSFQFSLVEGSQIEIVPQGNIQIEENVSLKFRLFSQFPQFIEFHLEPIDFYRQKSDEDFIGILNISSKENEHLVSIPIRLKKNSFEYSKKISSPIEISFPKIFNSILQSNIDDRIRFHQRLEMHSALINNPSEKNSLEKWLKRQNYFQLDRTIQSILKALIDIGQLDFAFHFHRQYLIDHLNVK